MLVVSSVPDAEKAGCSIGGGGSLTSVTFTVSVSSAELSVPSLAVTSIS